MQLTSLVLAYTTPGQLGTYESPDEDQGKPPPAEVIEVLRRRIRAGRTRAGVESLSRYRARDLCSSTQREPPIRRVRRRSGCRIADRACPRWALALIAVAALGD